jgi:hemolysin III
MLKGWSHLVAAVAATALCPILIALSPPGTRGPAAIFSGCVIALFLISGLYHRIQWSPRPHKVMQALDHSMIFIVIAATYTPIAAVALPDSQGRVILAIVWTGAILGALLNLAWPTAPRPVVVAPYLMIGWVAIAIIDDIWRSLGVAGFILLAAGGVLHSIGAIIYARKRPDPWPLVFGFHEIFHLFVIGGIACHYVVVAFFALR